MVTARQAIKRVRSAVRQRIQRIRRKATPSPSGRALSQRTQQEFRQLRRDVGQFQREITRQERGVRGAVTLTRTREGGRTGTPKRGIVTPARTARTRAPRTRRQRTVAQGPVRPAPLARGIPASTGRAGTISRFARARREFEELQRQQTRQRISARFFR